MFTSTPRPIAFTILLAMSALAYSSCGTAGVVQVTGYGEDSNRCGSTADPCRSISQAIANAAAGDSILVAPGRYGDLNGDGALGGPGEETGDTVNGCQCVVHVNKAVRLRSTHGAAVTQIDARTLAPPGATILVQANDVEIGRAGAGFLMSGSSGYGGLRVAYPSQRVKIAGNIAIGNSLGFGIFGSGIIIEHNLAANNDESRSIGMGFALSGANITARNNAATGQQLGFLVDGITTAMTDNIASANETGLLIYSNNAVLVRTTVTGNRLVGIRLISASQPSIRRSNIFGNGTGVGDNCGIDNQSSLHIVATDNFWGAPTGPGADPADQVCGNPVVIGPVSPYPITVPATALGNPF